MGWYNEFFVIKYNISRSKDAEYAKYIKGKIKGIGKYYTGVSVETQYRMVSTDIFASQEEAKLYLKRYKEEHDYKQTYGVYFSGVENKEKVQDLYLKKQALSKKLEQLRCLDADKLAKGIPCRHCGTVCKTGDISKLYPYCCGHCGWDLRNPAIVQRTLQLVKEENALQEKLEQVQKQGVYLCLLVALHF